MPLPVIVSLSSSPCLTQEVLPCRCPVDAMFHGDTFRPVEVTLALGEHNVQTVFVDHTAEHIVMGTYTQPARIIRLQTPSMVRSASLTLPPGDEMIYAGAKWGEHGVFVTR